MTAKELIAMRAARFFDDGDLVNLGIGIPALVADFVPEDKDVWFQAENGVIGLEGEAPEGHGDPNLVDAAGRQTALRVGGSCVDSFSSFGLIRGGHMDYTVLGAFEVDQEGNMANWMVPGKTVAGMGGAMDLVSGARQVLVAMIHTDKDGNPKILKRCTLPLTAAKKVNYIITELCVLKVTPDGLLLQELAPNVTVEEVQAKTEAQLIIPEVIGSMM